MHAHILQYEQMSAQHEREMAHERSPARGDHRLEQRTFSSARFRASWPHPPRQAGGLTNDEPCPDPRSLTISGAVAKWPSC